MIHWNRVGCLRTARFTMIIEKKKITKVIYVNLVFWREKISKRRLNNSRFACDSRVFRTC